MMKQYFKGVLLAVILALAVPATAESANTEPLRIKSVKNALVIVDRPKNMTNRLYAIYDVYKDKMDIDGVPLLVDFVDSIYLIRQAQGQFEFSYFWEGESRSMKEGYYIIPTGRYFHRYAKDITSIAGRAGDMPYPDRWFYATPGISMIIARSVSVETFAEIQLKFMANKKTGLFFTAGTIGNNILLSAGFELSPSPRFYFPFAATLVESDRISGIGGSAGVGIRNKYLTLEIGFGAMSDRYSGKLYAYLPMRIGLQMGFGTRKQ